MRLLVVDDDAIFVQLVAKSLVRQNYLVDIAMDGQIAWEMMQSQVYDLIVLDIMLPKLDGVSLCHKLRQKGCSIPILLLTARSSSSDKVAGLDAGADDYLIKPLDWQEFLARVRALLRREGAFSPAILTWGALSLNPKTCEVHYADQLLALRPREYKLLELLLRNPNRVFSCGAILEHLWSFEDQPSDDTIRAHIKGLRQKLRPVEAEDLIETVYGLGYRLRPVEEHPLVEEVPVVQPSSNFAQIDELQQAIAAAWQTAKPQILEQVAVLEATAHAVQASILEPQLRQQAIAEAHKLAGTVGSYGFKLGSQLSRQIEALLQDNQSFQPAEITTLQEQVTELRQALSAEAGIHSPRSANRLSNSAFSLHPANTIDSARILAVDDDPQIYKILKRVLEPWGLNLFTVLDNHKFWECLESTTPNLLLLDVEMPGISGLEICERIRNDSRWAGLPIVFLTAHNDTETIQKVFMAGADDFVTKPIVVPELVNRIITHIERHRLWQKLVERDGLTQLFTRSKFTQDLGQLIQTAEPQQQSVALIFLKINQLQSINHRHGYQAGDSVLRQIGELLSQEIKVEALIARWSGNKFAIAMYGKTGLESLHHLSSVIQALSERGLTVLDSTSFSLTPSTGFAQYPEDGKDVQALCCSAECRLAQSQM
ncbi:MAG: response regulator [Leptolyngbyaceae cyanobacterium CRU_2_3]|nr:response regulator [Leptolyngbyaceae cyanobacterium CRU_2_3]